MKNEREKMIFILDGGRFSDESIDIARWTLGLMKRTRIVYIFPPEELG